MRKIVIWIILLSFLLSNVNVFAAGNDSNCLLLTNCDGTDEATTFTDSSVGGTTHTITAVADANTETSTFKFGTASLETTSGGGNGKLTVEDHADFEPGTADWTLDFQFNVSGTDYVIFWRKWDTGNNWRQLLVYIDTDGLVYGSMSTNGTGSTGDGMSSDGGTDLSNGAWHHCAIVCSSTVVTIYIDGVAQTNGSTLSAALYDGNSQIWIGYADTGTGYMDEVRWSDSARWTANFTPPTEAYSEGGAAATSSMIFIGG